jgi:hypothetical protein
MLIYFIRNRVAGGVYVGQTTLTVAERWKLHCHAARYESSVCFTRAIRKYGPDAFEVITLGECSTGDLNHLCFLETFCIALVRALWPKEQVYNRTCGGLPGGAGKRKHPDVVIGPITKSEHERRVRKESGRYNEMLTEWARELDCHPMWLQWALKHDEDSIMRLPKFTAWAEKTATENSEKSA